MEDDCSRVWRQFDGLWMRAHSVPLTAQDNALCSPLPLSHNLAQHNGQRQTTSGSATLPRRYYYTRLHSAKVLFLFSETKRTVPKHRRIVFKKSVAVRNEQIGSFMLFVRSSGNSDTLCVERHRQSWKRTTFRQWRSEFPKLVGVLMSHFNFI